VINIASPLTENHLQGELNKVMNPGTKPMLWLLWQQCCLTCLCS